MKKESKSNAYRFTKDLMYVQLGDTYAYALLMFLCHAENKGTGVSWHGFDSIRRATGMGRLAIRAATHKLVELGLIEARLRRQDTKTYTVHYDALAALIDKGKAAYKAARQVANDLSQSHQDRSVTKSRQVGDVHQDRSVTHVKTGRNRPLNLVSN